jgi:tetratricopeptide (TPR) repeat protein
LKDFETARERDPDYWKAIHNLGVSRAVAGDFAQALQDFDRVVELKPEYANAWFNRAEIHFEQGDYESAATGYSAAIRLKPEDTEARLRRGHAYFQRQQFEDALADYQEVTDAEKEQNPLSLLHRGHAHRRLGHWQKAAEDYRRAITLDERFGAAYQAAAWLMATCPDQRFRNEALAIRAAQKAVELDGQDNYLALDALAAAHANEGEFIQAREAIEKALALAPAREIDALKERQALYAKDRAYRENAAPAGGASDREAATEESEIP